MILSKPLSLPDLPHERSNRFIELILRNQLATNDVLHRRVVPDVATDTAQKMIRRLIKRSLLKRWPLHGAFSYLRLGSAAITRWQYPPKYARRLGPQTLAYQLGCLSLMSYSEPPLTRLFPWELEEFGLPYTRDLHQWAYYREESEGRSRLGTVRVQFRNGGEFVIRKLTEQLHNYRRHQAFSSLLDEQRLIVHVVTATAEQEESIWEAADKSSFPAELRTGHDPGLTQLL